MTREEAYNEIFSQDSMEDARNVINSIFDDFGSRTCDNCRHSQQVNKIGTLECYKDVSSWHIDHDYGEAELYVDKDFGCNKFERK